MKVNVRKNKTSTRSTLSKLRNKTSATEQLCDEMSIYIDCLRGLSMSLMRTIKTNEVLIGLLTALADRLENDDELEEILEAIFQDDQFIDTIFSLIPFYYKIECRLNELSVLLPNEKNNKNSEMEAKNEKL